MRLKSVAYQGNGGAMIVQIVQYKAVVGLNAQLSKFSVIISKGFKKPKRKLIIEMLYGIQASKNVKLSNISRTLKEEQSLIKTEGRLSRNLDDHDFTDGINEEITNHAWFLPDRKGEGEEKDGSLQCNPVRLPSY
jgi:hypothetical protein